MDRTGGSSGDLPPEAEAGTQQVASLAEALNSMVWRQAHSAPSFEAPVLLSCHFLSLWSPKVVVRGGVAPGREKGSSRRRRKAG